MYSKYQLWLPMSLALGALALVGCPGKTLDIGAVVPITGENSTYGEAVRKGLMLAYDEIQADTERQSEIVLEVVDSKSNPEAAAEELAKLYKDGAVVAIGGITTPEAKAMLQVIDKFDRVMLSPTASSPEFTGISRNFYRIVPSDYSAANKMAQAAEQVLGIKTIVIIAEEQPYAEGVQGVFVPAFENTGGEVLETIGFPPNTSDLAALVSRAVSLNPDAVYLAGYAAGIGSMIRELRRLNFKGKILTTSAFASPSMIAEVGDDAAGVFLTQTVFELDSEHAHVRQFVQAYREKYDEDPDIYAAYGYDVLKVLAFAMDGHPALPSEVNKALRDEVTEYPGVTGSIQFDEKGDVRKFPRLYLISRDLLLVDYNEVKQKRQEEIRAKREALQEKLENLQKNAESIGG